MGIDSLAVLHLVLAREHTFDQNQHENDQGVLAFYFLCASTSFIFGFSHICHERGFQQCADIGKLLSQIKFFFATCPVPCLML